MKPAGPHLLFNRLEELKMLATDTLFRPFALKSLSVPNRIVMAPMTRSFAIDGIPRQAQADYYRRRAEGGVGLILSEAAMVDRPSAGNEPTVPSFYGKPALAGWRGVIDAVHAAGGRMGPQFMHAGSVKSSAIDWEPAILPESPSGLVTSDIPRGTAMSEEAVADTVAAFAKAAGHAKRLGFDTIEMHGAHGYLIDQFFWSETNRRSDRYGGATLKDRTRFAADIIGAVREEVGPDFPIILRLSQWKGQDYSARLAETPAAMADWLTPLVEAGADILHCSTRRFWEPEFADVDGEAGLNFAGWAKKLTGAATISVGSVGLSRDVVSAFSGESSDPAGLDELIRRMDKDEFDLIAVGRALITDPNWVRKVQAADHAGMMRFDTSALAELV
jgi:2,4-dienoyl-CoA reductase-like NADH-dependent reductase (Old Yellow Enzyme family)